LPKSAILTNMSGQTSRTGSGLMSSNDRWSGTEDVRRISLSSGKEKKTNKTQICKPYKSVHRLLVKLSLPFGLSWGLRKPSGADADEAGWTWASVISVKLLRCSTSTQERERERKWTNLDNWWKEIKNFGLLFDPPFLRVGFTAHASSAAWKLVPFVSVSLHPAILTQQQQRKKTFRHQAFPSTSQLQPS
jgi:hypothetical protein